MPTRVPAYWRDENAWMSLESRHPRHLKRSSTTCRWAYGRGGPLLTKTLLVSALSAGGSDGGARLVAFDKATGEELGSVDLPRGAIGTPMTYRD